MSDDDIYSTPIVNKDFKGQRIDKFLGTFYSSTYDSKLLSNPDFVEYYLPFTEYSMTNYKSDGVSTYKGTVIYQNIRSDSGGYLAFLGGDIPLSVIQTNNQTGKSIIVLKESYGNAFVPFLLPHYDTIYVADIRTFPFNLTDYVVEKNITDVLFCNNIMTACSAARVINIMNLLNWVFPSFFHICVKLFQIFHKRFYTPVPPFFLHVLNINFSKIWLCISLPAFFHIFNSPYYYYYPKVYYNLSYFL